MRPLGYDAAMASEPPRPPEPPVPPDPPSPPAPPAAPDSGKRNKQLMAGVAVGIGSAAIVAALLYANRSRKGD